jgi:metaxin
MATTSSTPPTPRLLAIPQPLRRLFNAFPLHTLPPNALPYRSPSSSASPSSSSSSSSAGHHRLYIFTDNADGRPSYNPSCLKAQSALRIAGIEVAVESSNNHASPSGALPFLMTDTGKVLSGGKIFDFARDNGSIPTVKNPKIQAYRALLDNAVRPAWVRKRQTHTSPQLKNPRELTPWETA